MKMKKILSIALAACMVFAVTGCSSESSEEKEEAGNEEKVEDEAENPNTEYAKVIDVDLTTEEYAFGVDKTQEDLLEQVNDFVGKIMENGTLDEILNEYFGDGEPEPVDSAEPDDSADQLVVATNAKFAPFEYMEGDSYYGIDMEIARLLAKELGKELVIKDMEFVSVCPSVGEQECDIAMSAITVNEEREEDVNFSTTYYEASQQLIVPGEVDIFDGCTTAEEVENLINEQEDITIGVQADTTAEYYVQGDEEYWDFPGLNAECISYKNEILAMEAMLKGNVDYVIMDAAPAAVITEDINKTQ